MQKIIIILCCVISLGLAHGLEVHLTKEYYDVDPDSVDSIQSAMMKASPFSDSNDDLHTIGSYEASTMVNKMHLIYDNGHCTASVFEMALNGTMTLPKLMKSDYSKNIQQSFEEMRYSLEQHEYVHEKIWQDALQNFEQKIRNTILIDNKQCDQLINEINQEMTKVLEDIMARNSEFDCASYGDQLNLSQCY